jgi:hypothetical protein
MMRITGLLVAAVASVLLAACGGDDGPTIERFSAEPDAVQPGESTTLVAQFSGGIGRIDGGVGAVTSGSAVTVTPSDSTTYTLTVSDDGGRSVSATAKVDRLFVSLSEFDEPGDWRFKAVLDKYDFTDESEHGSVRSGLSDGALSIGASQGRDGLCQSASAELVLSDAKIVAGSYASLVFEFKVQGAAATGLGDTGYWSVGQGSVIASGSFPDGGGGLMRVELEGVQRFRVLLEGVEVLPWSPTRPSTKAPSVYIGAGACSSDLGSDSVDIDWVRVTGR